MSRASLQSPYTGSDVSVLLRSLIGDYGAGQIDLLSDRRGTRVRVHWPADRELDEWIDLSLELDYRAEGEIAASGRIFSVGTPNNSLQMIKSNDGHFLLRCTGANSIGPIQADLALDEEARAELLGHFAHALALRA